MSYRGIFLLLFIMLLCGVYQPVAAHILNLADGNYIGLEDMLDDLETSQVIFIGELHDTQSHHDAQLRVIRELVERGRKVAIGLEMFRHDGQMALDDWSQGKLEKEVFKTIFNDHWSMWPVYAELFNFARARQLPLIGLNIDRDITRQISTSGFSSLTEDQLQQLDGVSCDVDQRYQDYLRKALGSHLATLEKFSFFCEAQMVWDNVMVQHLLEWHRQSPDTLLVVLAGSGHAWRYGMPEQLRRRSDLSFRILLPEIIGRTDSSNTTSSEADYLLLGLGQGELH